MRVCREAVVTVREKIEALEVLGSYVAYYKNSITAATSYWKRAITLRYGCIKAYSSPSPPVTHLSLLYPSFSPTLPTPRYPLLCSFQSRSLRSSRLSCIFLAGQLLVLSSCSHLISPISFYISLLPFIMRQYSFVLLFSLT